MNTRNKSCGASIGKITSKTHLKFQSIQVLNFLIIKNCYQANKKINNHDFLIKPNDLKKYFIFFLKITKYELIKKESDCMLVTREAPISYKINSTGVRIFLYNEPKTKNWRDKFIRMFTK